MFWSGLIPVWGNVHYELSYHHTSDYRKPLSPEHKPTFRFMGKLKIL